MNTATSRRADSHQRLFDWNQPIVAAAKTREAIVAETTTSTSSNQPWTSMRRSCGLKIQTNGRITVRSA